MLMLRTHVSIARLITAIVVHLRLHRSPLTVLMRQEFCQFGSLEQNLAAKTLALWRGLFAAGRDTCKGLARHASNLHVSSQPSNARKTCRGSRLGCYGHCERLLFVQSAVSQPS